MKILIFGGSFDPVHKGHKALLKAAIAQIKPDFIHVFTAWQSPFKNKSAMPFEARQNMAKAALGPLSPKIIFDDFEKRAKRVVYTWETIKYIRAKYPGADVYLLTGSDCLNDIQKWKNAKYIFANAVVAAGARKGFKFTAKDFDYILIKGSFPEVSSSQIRIDTWLKKNLTPGRYHHTKCTLKAAVELARIYNVDAQKTALAALLHDIAKDAGGPPLLHGAASARMAEKIFGVKDKDILAAIKNHTLGAPDMSALQKIIYIADMCGADRRPAEARQIKKAAKKSLDEGLLAAMSVKLIYTIQTKKWLAPQAIKLWNKLVSKQNS